MKKWFIAVVCVLACLVSGCATTVGDINAAAAKTAAAVCPGITTAYQSFVATGLGSEKDKAAVEAAYNATGSICADPSKATAVSVVFLGAQLTAIVKTMRKVKANG